MRLTVPRIESTWSWLACFSSVLRPPLFAVELTRLWSSFRSELTSFKPPSAVPMMLLARWALLMAELMPVFSARRFSLAMRPAGSSLPLLIFRPVLNRSRLVLSLSWLPRNTRWAISELTFVLILLMVCLSVTSAAQCWLTAAGLLLRSGAGLRPARRALQSLERLWETRRLLRGASRPPRGQGRINPVAQAVGRPNCRSPAERPRPGDGHPIDPCPTSSLTSPCAPTAAGGARCPWWYRRSFGGCFRSRSRSNCRLGGFPCAWCGGKSWELRRSRRG